MNARRCDDVAAVSLRVDAGYKTRATSDGPTRMAEENVCAAAARGRSHRPRQLTIFSFEHCERLVAAVAGIDVDEDDPGLDPCSDPEVRVGSARLPRITHPVLPSRALPSCVDGALPT